MIVHVESYQESPLREIEVKKLEKSNINDLQSFLENFNDFFMLCEGVSASAESILSECPPTKNINQDKLWLGAYKSGSLIGFLDIIKGYPSEKVITIGYLLVHPAYRSLGIGTFLVHNLSTWAYQQGFRKLRLGVQKQNPRALAFWQRNGFNVTKTLEEKLGEKLNTTDVLELEFSPIKSDIIISI